MIYGLYLLCGRRAQNGLLLAASCAFYAAWDWRFVFLMHASIAVSYFCAGRIHASEDPAVRKRWLRLGVAASLAVLGIFKYFNFFTESFEALLGRVGLPVHLGALNILLPVGISFYTFEAISYVCDIHRKAALPAKDYWDYALFVSYFPHLVAGPIMRAKDFLPQIELKRDVTRQKVYEGGYLILWGFFQKVFVGDNLAAVVRTVFAGPAPYDGTSVLIGAYAFAFQIYCDFAGYSNIARGLGKCMGFEITVNFDLPYFSASPSEFWRRWHISLSTWLRDYLYIPLGGNRGGTLFTARNLMITMLLGGLWHGASWTFVLWGAYHGLLLILYRGMEPVFAVVRGAVAGRPAGAVFLRAAGILLFFHLVCLGWLIFRAESAAQLGQMLNGLFFRFGAAESAAVVPLVRQLIFYTAALIAVESFQFRRNDLLAVLRWPVPARVALYLVCIYSIVIFGVNHAQDFIYFQF